MANMTNRFRHAANSASVLTIGNGSLGAASLSGHGGDVCAIAALTPTDERGDIRPEQRHGPGDARPLWSTEAVRLGR